MNSPYSKSFCFFRWMSLILVVAAVSRMAAQNNSAASVPAPCTAFPTISTSGSTGCGETDARSNPRADESNTAPVRPESPAQVMLGQTPVNQTLDGEPVFEPRPYHIEYLYGGRLIGGYDSAAIGPNSALKGTGFDTYDGYLGAALQTRKSYFVIQQDSFGNQYTASGLPGQYLFMTSAMAAGVWSPAAKWHIEGHSTEGDGALLFLSPLPATAVGQTAATFPNAADLGLDNSFAWYPDISAGVSLKLNPVSTFVMYAKDSYREIFDNNTHDNVAQARPSLEFSLSNRTTFGVYGLSTRETGEIDCRSNGGGLEISTRFLKTGYLDVRGGPQFGSKGCVRQQSYEYHVEVAAQVSRNLDAYLIANRESGNTLVAGGDWEDNVGIGIKRRFGRLVTLGIDGGYVNGVHLGSNTNYQGAYGAVEVRKRINSVFLISGAYRRFDNNETAPALHRNVVLFSFIFSPSRRVRAEKVKGSGVTNE
jgi:hypothetical protein